uniref:NADH-ubiquinone oxidoreductase chain 6 n=1 Tax=Megaloprepus caerulatus TaxID=263994 RepID=A0A342ZZN7_9ODON|nr:NADH dehydrogenase subunit 6 [Megaloprepus caerulatus]AOW43838.1 NADH dehydrogenase subunit 6 [Megaloprepus caerulatus]
MSHMISMMFSLINSVFFFLMKHPMSMGMVLLVQTTSICVITSSMSMNSWFSYILFLVFLGGMLILFIYMTSVASNDMFMKNKNFFMILNMIIIIISPLMVLDPFMMNNNSEESMEITKLNNSMNLNMFNYPNNILTIIMVLYLLLTLTVVVKVTEYNQGPLRAKN